MEEDLTEKVGLKLKTKTKTCKPARWAFKEVLYLNEHELDGKGVCGKYVRTKMVEAKQETAYK